MAAKLNPIVVSLLGLIACPAWAAADQDNVSPPAEARSQANSAAPPETPTAEAPPPAEAMPIPSPPAADVSEPAAPAPPPPPPARPPPPPPPPPSYPNRYTTLEVLGLGVSEFHYLRQDLFLSLGRSNAARLRKVEQLGYFGPNPAGSSVPVRAGDNYLVVPVCKEQLNWTYRALVQVPAGRRGKVTLKCRP
jgi:hypothetical protein